MHIEQPRAPHHPKTIMPLPSSPQSRAWTAEGQAGLCKYLCWKHGPQGGDVRREVGPVGAWPLPSEGMKVLLMGSWLFLQRQFVVKGNTHLLHFLTSHLSGICSLHT